MSLWSYFSVSDHNEDDAYVHVSATHRSRDPIVHLIAKSQEIATKKKEEKKSQAKSKPRFQRKLLELSSIDHYYYYYYYYYIITTYYSSLRHTTTYMQNICAALKSQWLIKTKTNRNPTIEKPKKKT